MHAPTGDDPYAGLDPEEAAEARRLAAQEPDGAATADPHRRIVALLAVFVVIFLPVVLGAMWLAERAIYRPLCAADDAAEVVDVEIDLPIDASPQSDGDDGRTTCVYADGTRTAMQERIGTAQAGALDIGLALAALGLPFLLTWLVALATRRRGPRRRA